MIMSSIAMSLAAIEIQVLSGGESFVSDYFQGSYTELRTDFNGKKFMVEEVSYPE